MLTLTWEERGRIQEGMLRMDHGLIPDESRIDGQNSAGITAPTGQGPASDHRSERYKVKLSRGNAWQNLKPESWIVFDVTGGTTITLKHSTNTVNLITGLSRWWDHPVLSIQACPLFPPDDDHRQAGCLQGGSAGSGEPLRIVLPEGASLHDYVFSFTWQENGRIQERKTLVDRMVQPTPIPSR